MSKSIILDLQKILLVKSGAIFIFYIFYFEVYFKLFYLRSGVFNLFRIFS
jgi:hypothetical protein